MRQQLPNSSSRRQGRARRNSRLRSSQRFRRALWIEPLEDRRMLAIGINLLAADDSGWSNSDRLTNVTQPRFEVTVDQPGQIAVDFNADGTSDAQQSVDAAGTYEFRSSTLADGAHTIAATFTPLAGDAEQASHTATIDTLEPK